MINTQKHALILILTFFISKEIYGSKKEHLKSVKDVVWTWEYPNEDIFYDLSFQHKQGFIETSIKGSLGGVLKVLLPKGTVFKENAEKYIDFNDLPEGVSPLIKVINNKVTISLKGKAIKRNTERITIIISKRAIKGEINKNSLSLDNIPIHYHDVPLTFISPVTNKRYQLVFNDEFNDTQLNIDVWSYRAETYGDTTRVIKSKGKQIPITVANNASSLSNGQLRLDVRWEKSKRSIVTGGIHTRESFLPRYGYYETEVSFHKAKGKGYWPAFWIHFPDSTKYSNGTEIDIFEYIPRDKEVFQTLHWHKKESKQVVDHPEIQHFDTTNVQQQKQKEHFSSTKNFRLENPESHSHKFAVEWTPEELIFYTNGEVTRRVDKSKDTREVPSAYQMLFFSCSAGTWGGNVADTDNPLPFFVYFNYCRGYQEIGQDAFYTYHDKTHKISVKERLGKH